jgi:diguanylate cyclase (GGDEF)-like protein/PAS domain S-box-containing protein
MAKWVQSVRQTTTYLGFAVIAVIWSGVVLLNRQDHQRAYEDAVRQGGNLALVLEEYVQRIVLQSDNVLLALRRDFQRDAQHFDLVAWARDTQFHSSLTANIGITDAKGYVTLSSRKHLAAPAYVGDRAPFTFQRDAAASDLLFISDPVIGSVSNELSIQFTRPINAPDGTFAGTVAISLSVGELERFFSSLDLGSAGIVSLVHTDGVVLVRGGSSPTSRNYEGTKITSPRFFEAVRENPTGSFWNTAASSAQFEGAKRLISYRVLPGLPLIAVVGLADKTIFQQADESLQKYALIGLILTAVVLIVVVVAARRHAQMLATASELQRSNHLLNTALTNMTHGLCMFDKHGRLVICNEHYGAMYGLGPEHMMPGTPIRSILKARVDAGMSPEDGEKYIGSRLDDIAGGVPRHTETQLSNGKVYAISHQPMPDGGWVGTHADITEQRRAERALAETKRFLDTIIDNIPVSVVVKNAKTRGYILVNRAYETMVQMSRPDILGKTVFDIFRSKDAEFMNRTDTESIYAEKDDTLYKEYEVETPKSGLRIQGTRRFVVRDDKGEPKYLIAVIDDITERKRAEHRIAYLALHDGLTGLANRTALRQKIDEAATRWRSRGEPFSVLLLDLDRFKQVNDSLGHPAGDRLLTEVATRLKSLLRETDVLARLGGDEFAIIQGGDDDPRCAAASLADRIIEMIGKSFVIEGDEITIGTSIGIALASEHQGSSDEILKMADLALYRAKSAGRNGYRFFDPEMSAVATARQEIESDLRRAIQQNELVLYYQPIIDSRSGKICGAEALIRWRHPTKGLLLPDSFIPLAEESGLISQIGDWVLRTACAQAASWPAHVKVAVNLSVMQFQKPNLADSVTQALAASGLAAERLELEVTETALIESAAECLPALRHFKSLGITIVLDDFGTGYSSLSQLTLFPFDKIKIDKSFTQNLTKRSECAAIISATLTLAQTLDIATTAEGVETADQHRLLRLAGVTSLQGFFFQRPVPRAEIDFDRTYAAGAIGAAA